MGKRKSLTISENLYIKLKQLAMIKGTLKLTKTIERLVEEEFERLGNPGKEEVKKHGNTA